MADARSEEFITGKEINRTREAKTFIIVPDLNKLNWGHSKQLHGHSPLYQTPLPSPRIILCNAAYIKQPVSEPTNHMQPTGLFRKCGFYPKRPVILVLDAQDLSVV